MIIRILIPTTIIIFTFLNTLRLLSFIQQSSYHLYSIKKVLKEFFKDKLFIINLTPLLFLIPQNNTSSIILLIILSLLFTFYEVIKHQKKFIIKLKITKRVKRILLVYTLFLIFIVYLYFKNIYFIYFLTLFYIFLIYLSLILLIPVEILIQYKFVLKSQKKLKQINPLVIGITGSAGKTTTKNIIANLLAYDFSVFKTPKSYNTINGISKSINEEMDNTCEVCIIEYGASRKNDIFKSLKLVKPNISIITNINTQHLETFKTIENIKKEKVKIIEGSTLHIKQNQSHYEIPKGIITLNVSLNSKSDFYATDIVYKKDGMEFLLNGLYKMSTNLLGENNVLNILFGICVLKYLKPSITYDEISYRVSKLETTPNRKELLLVNNKTIINDSFNSNEFGFIEAIKILSLYNGHKILITPGVVSGEVERINKKIALLICEENFEVYLITSVVSNYYKDIFDSKLIIYSEFDSFKKAYQKAINSKATTILIENDIGDIYKR